MQAGNVVYETIADLSPTLPVFPLEGALLLPRTQMSLNIFESRYIEMMDTALSGNRLIGMIQPLEEDKEGSQDSSAVQTVGCVGRLTGFQETGDGRYIVMLQGICRFSVVREMEVISSFRRFECDFSDFVQDLQAGFGQKDVDRDALLDTLRKYLDANNMEMDWESVADAETEVLVNALCMMSPCSPKEKQALLEATTLKNRAETLIAITEMDLMGVSSGEGGTSLQ